MNFLKSCRLVFLFSAAVGFFSLASPRVTNTTSTGAIKTTNANDVHASSVFQTNVFDPDTQTFYMGHKKSDTLVATGNKALMSAKFSGGAMVTKKLAVEAGLLDGNFRSIGLIKSSGYATNGKKYLVVIKEDHGDAGFGDNDQYAESATASASASVPTLYLVDPETGALVGTALVLRDSSGGATNAVGGNDGILDRITIAGDKIVAVVVKNSNPSDLLTSGSEHVIRVVTLVGDQLTHSGVAVTAAAGSTLLKITGNDGNSTTLDEIGHLISGYTAITNVGCPIRSVTSMHWDEDLQRLFVGFLCTDANGLNSDQRRFVMVGRFDGVTNNLLFSEIIPTSVVDNLTFVTDDEHGIVATKSEKPFMVNHMKTLKSSSTGNNKYLVVQVRVGDAGANGGLFDSSHKVFAVPLLGDGDGVTAALRGHLAQKASTRDSANKFKDAVALATDLYLPNDIQALVGGAPLPAFSDSDITDLQVCGDTVYACVIGADASDNQAETHLAGVYSSTAIFDVVGIIKAWTPWTRVIASADSVLATDTVGADNPGTSIYSLGIDKTNGRFHFVFGQTEDDFSLPVNGVGVTGWGVGNDFGYPFSHQNLEAQVNTDFAGEGGVFGCNYFPAIKTAGLGSSDLGVVLGHGKAALFSTGGVLSQNAYDFNGSDQLSDELIFDLSKRAYAPVAYRNVDFAADATGAPLNKHYKLFSDLPIGDPFCCEVSRSVNNSPAADVMTALHQENGFVFVGGAGGLAVLSRNDGTGFDSSVGSAGGLGSDIEDFTADPQSFGDATFAFRKIPGIEESVHDLVSTGRYLYVMTPKNLYRIRLHAEKGLAGAAEMFDTAELNAAPTMFSSAMSHVDATSVASLEVLTGGEQTTFAGKVTTAHFSKGQVVIQKVMTLGDDEHFAQMIGVPNSQVIFVATNSAKTISHKIYVIKEGDNPALTTIKTAIATADNKITGSNESFRRMHLAMCNTFNQNLTQGDGAALTLTSGVTIANLYVLTGSVFSPSKLLRYEIVGGVEAADVDVPGSHYRYPRVGLAAATAWHSAATTVSSTGFLANGMTTDSGPMLFASSNASGAGTEGHLWRFDPAATNSMRALESGSATKSEYRALFPTATGSQQFFGSFGVVGQE